MRQIYIYTILYIYNFYSPVRIIINVILVTIKNVKESISIHYMIKEGV